MHENEPKFHRKIVMSDEAHNLEARLIGRIVAFGARKIQK